MSIPSALIVSYGLISISFAIVLSAQPLVGGQKEMAARIVAITFWPFLVHGAYQTGINALDE